MKNRIFAVLAVSTLLATSVFAGEVESVLAPDSTFWTVNVPAHTTRLEVIRRKGEAKESILVPGTNDGAVESDVRLAWDNRSNSLLVIWTRTTDGVDEIVAAAFRADETWTEPIVLASDASKRAGLQVAVTYHHEKATEETPEAPATPAVDTTFLHAAWWKIDGEHVEPEYALVAFEGGSQVSSDVSVLSAIEDQAVAEPEDTGEAIHPPLAMVRAGEGVEIIFGESNTTAVNRTRLVPRKIEGNARMWRPGKAGNGNGQGGQQHRTPSANLVSGSTEPVQAFISNGRIVLYTPDAQFRYVVYENGQWTPTRMIQLDENLTSDQLLRELHKTVDEQITVEEAAQQ
jgi:hypothetical protein